MPDLAGSLGGGGRYDGLIGMFLGEDSARVRVLARARADSRRDGGAQHVPAAVQQASADVLVTLFDAATVPEALRLAAELRRAGVRVEVYPEPDKLGKQMKYADGEGDPVRRGPRRRRDRPRRGHDQEPEDRRAAVGAPVAGGGVLQESDDQAVAGPAEARLPHGAPEAREAGSGKLEAGS